MVMFSIKGTGVVQNPMTPDEIQNVYDEAFERGILDEPLIYDPASGVTRARIEGGNLIENVRANPSGADE